jgi:hypothetical protein
MTMMTYFHVSPVNDPIIILPYKGSDPHGIEYEDYCRLGCDKVRFFVGCLMKVSVWRLYSVRLEKILKEVAVAYSRFYTSICFEELMKPRKSLVILSRLKTETRTEELSNIRQEHYVRATYMAVLLLISHHYGSGSVQTQFMSEFWWTN